MEPQPNLPGVAAPPKNPASAPAIAEAAIAATIPDPLTADIMRRHDAGEKLTPQELGKLGAFKAKLSRKKNGRPLSEPPPAPAPPARTVAPPVGQPATAPQAPGEAPGTSIPLSPLDSALVQDTTRALCESLSQLAHSIVTNAAIRAGADAKTAEGFGATVEIPAASKVVMVQTSPAVAEALGVNPRNYPIAAFGTAFAAWLGQIGLSVASLNKLAKELKGKNSPGTAAAPAPVIARGTEIPAARPTQPEVRT